MNISLNGLWTNTNNYIRTKIAEGLTPLQKKVALLATAFFALAAVGYLFYQFCCKNPSQTKVIDPKEKDKPVQVTEQSKNNQEDQPTSPSELSEKGPLDAEKPLDPEKVNVEEIVPSSANIAIHNADQLRSRINNYAAEAQDPSGQLRTLDFDAEGRLQGIKGPDDNQIWLKGKTKGHHSYQIKIRFQKSESIQNRPFLLENNLGICPENLREIIDSTLNELNQLANGAFHIAKSDKNLPARPDTPKWLTVLENVTDYPSSRLLGEVQDIEDNASSLPQQLPINVIPELEAEDDTPELMVDTPEIDNQESKLDPIWINDNPNTSLKDLGLSDYDNLKDFIIEHGVQLKCLNLIGHKIDNAQFEQLIKSCPNLTHLFINSPIIEDNALEHLKGMPLTSVNLRECWKLTDYALEHLKGMPLTSVNFRECDNLTDNALEHLKGMPLTSVNFRECWRLTDNALKHLKGMPLTSVDFSLCGKLTDNALDHLKGMPLTSVSFRECRQLTDNALEHLKGMPLTSVSFRGCWNLTDNALEHLKGMQLTSVSFYHCRISDKALEHFKGMPLTSVSFSLCGKLTDNALEHLKGMPLTHAKFGWCGKLTDNALKHLKGMPLTSVDFSECSELTDNALEHLKGMPLTSVDFSECGQLTDNALEHLKGMPLTSVNFSWCDKLTDNALKHLKGMQLTNASFHTCTKLTPKALAELKN